jgi:transposase
LRKVRLDGAGTAYLRSLSKVPKGVNRLQKFFPPSISSMKQAQMAHAVNKPDVTRAAQWRESSQSLSKSHIAIFASTINKQWWNFHGLSAGADFMTPSVVGWFGGGWLCGRRKTAGDMTAANWRYSSDRTDDAWARVEPMIPSAKDGGNKRRVNVRELANGIMHILSTGYQWRAVSKDLPPRSALSDYLDLWSGDREASPTAAIIDRQCVKSAEKSWTCIDPKWVWRRQEKGKKRHIPLDTQVCCSTRRSIRPTFRIAMEATFGSQQKFYGAPTSLDRRRNHRLAEPLSQVGQRLRP